MAFVPSQSLQLRSIVCVEEMLPIDFDIRDIIIARGRHSTEQCRRSAGQAHSKLHAGLDNECRLNECKRNNEAFSSVLGTHDEAWQVESRKRSSFRGSRYFDNQEWTRGLRISLQVLFINRPSCVAMLTAR